MKLNLITQIISISFLFSSCVKEYEEYTFAGKFLNGTTGLPYTNIQVDFVARSAGYPSSRVIDLGTAKTNENGEFSLKYSIESNFPGKLSVIFRDPINPYIDLYSLSNLPVLQSQYQLAYLSDSGTVLIRFLTNNILSNDESLRVYLYQVPSLDTTLYFNTLNMNDVKLSFRLYDYNNIIVWERISKDTTIIGSEYLTYKRDPFIDSITINY